MRIVVCLLNYRPGQIGGTETILQGLLQHLPQVVCAEDEVLALGFRGNADKLNIRGLTPVIIEKNKRSILAARCLEAFTPLRAGFAERQLVALRPDVVLFPQQSMFPKRVDCPTVLVVNDIQHLMHPGNFSRFDRWFRAQIYTWSLQRADKIVAISEWTRRTLIERCGVPSEKVVTIQPGFFPMEIPAEVGRRPLAEPYLYFPAATYPHKGHGTLLATFAALRGGASFPYKLVLSGQQTPHWNKLRAQIERLGIGDDVIHRGFVTREDVIELYRGADAVIFPTEFEGFGLPVLEAVQFRKKIICSRLEVFDEIGVPQQFQIDFSVPDQLLAALALPGPTALEKEPATWLDTSRRILATLRSVARKQPCG